MLNNNNYNYNYNNNNNNNQEEEEDDDDIDSIDESWVNEFKEEEEEYNDFYKEKVDNITLFFLYVNKEKELESISKEPYLLEHENGLITKDQLVTIIKKRQEKHLNATINNNNNDNNSNTTNHLKNNIKKYKLISLYRYNPCLDSEDINSFIERNDYNKLNENENDNFFFPEKYLNDVVFDDTITIFQDLNSLFFIYYEKEIKPENNNNTNNNNNTRKIITVNFDKSKKSKKRKNTRRR